MRTWLWRMLLTLALAAGARGEPLSIYTEELPPISYQENGKLRGLMVDVVAELLNRLGRDEPVTLLPWARAYQYLQTRPGVLLFPMGDTAERETQMTLLGPVAQTRIMVFARKGEAARLRALGDALYRQPIAAFRSSVFYTVAQQRGFTQLRASNDPSQSMQWLLHRRVELCVDGELVIPQTLRRAGYPADALEPVLPLRELPLYLAFSRGTSHGEILVWQQQLARMKQDGSLARIYQQWLPGLEAPPGVERLGLEAGAGLRN